MADLRGRSRRSQQRRSSRPPRPDHTPSPLGSSRHRLSKSPRQPHSDGALVNRSSPQSSSRPGEASDKTPVPFAASKRRSRQRTTSRDSVRSAQRRRRYPSTRSQRQSHPNAGPIMLRQPGAIIRSNAAGRSRDGRQVPLGPDPRRRSQVGAYASAFGGRRSHLAATDSATATPSLVPRSPTLTAFPGAKAAGTDRPVQRLSPRPVAAPSLRKPRRKRLHRPVSPWVYGVRLLILGVGISAIAGTVLSALNPSRQELAADEAVATRSDTSALDRLMATPESGRSLMRPLQLNQPLNELSKELQAIVSNYPELKPGIFFYDLDTGNYVNLSGAEPFAAASTIKVPVLIAFFQEVEAGTMSYDEILAIEAEDLAAGSGNLQFQPVGTEYTALEVASAMIIISDNTATNMLIRRMGGIEVLNQRFRSWGLQYTALNSPLPDLEGTNLTSPQELVELMTMVSREDLLTGRSRDRLLHIMGRTQTNSLLPQGLSDEASIFHKTGDIGSMLGDVGLVDVPNGKRYAIAVQVQRPHNDARAREVIHQISNRVYEVMEATPLDAAPSPQSARSDAADSTLDADSPDADLELPDAGDRSTLGSPAQ